MIKFRAPQSPHRYSTPRIMGIAPVPAVLGAWVVVVFISYDGCCVLCWLPQPTQEHSSHGAVHTSSRPSKIADFGNKVGKNSLEILSTDKIWVALSTVLSRSLVAVISSAQIVLAN